MSMRTTKTDRAATEWRIEDEGIRLREWGTDVMYPLPRRAGPSAGGGPAAACALLSVAPAALTSREHAGLDHHKRGGLLRDLDSKNGARLDGARRSELWLQPGIELGVGGSTL